MSAIHAIAEFWMRWDALIKPAALLIGVVAACLFIGWQWRTNKNSRFPICVLLGLAAWHFEDWKHLIM